MASNSIPRGKEITQEFLKECLHFNHKTGCLKWKTRPLSHFVNESICKSWNKRYAGKDAGNINKKIGYRQISLNKKLYYAHRLIWLYHFGVDPKKQIDHINCNKADNRISNLREADHSENRQNIIKARKDNVTSGLLGSSFNKLKGKFVAYISIGNIKKNLGYFDTPEEAHAAYLKAKREIHPFGTL